MVVSDGDKDRENWVRLTLRLPPELHAEIVKRAGTVSLNSAIVQLLQSGLDLKDLDDELKNLVAMKMRERQQLNDEIRRELQTGAAAITKLNDDLLEKLSQVVRVSVRDEITKALGKEGKVPSTKGP